MAGIGKKRWFLVLAWLSGPLLIGAAEFAPALAPPVPSRLEVEVVGAADGAAVAIALYPESVAKAFPLDDARAAVKRVVPEAGVARVSFDGLSRGRYALSVYQDLDGDGRLKANFLGIPREPVAVSRDAKGKFGPPSFADAAFAVSRPMERQIVRLGALK